MKPRPPLVSPLLALAIGLSLGGCQTCPTADHLATVPTVPTASATAATPPPKTQLAPAFRKIKGFSAPANQQLEAFLKRTASVQGRKVAVFDGDGTVFGQTPHYLADECLYAHADKHPDRKAALIQKMAKQSNVSIPYVQNRIHYLAGLSLEAVREMGAKCHRELYPDKIFIPMRELIALLGEHGFEVWVVTASPESLYQKFLSNALGIPITHVVGVKSVVRGGLITDEMVEPIPQDHGKKEAIETFVQQRPLLVGGNSRGDKEMIEYSQDLKIIVNPDEHVAPDQTESIAAYAKRQGWLIVQIRDVPEPNFPAISSKNYGVRLNKTRDVPVAE